MPMACQRTEASKPYSLGYGIDLSLSFLKPVWPSFAMANAKFRGC